MKKSKIFFWRFSSSRAAPGCSLTWNRQLSAPPEV